MAGIGNMFWLFVSIFMGAVGQLFLKMASNASANQRPLLTFYRALAVDWHLWVGFTSYGFSFLIWMWVLTRYDLSYARPMVGLGYVITAFLGLLFLDEKITLARWAGIILIVAGVIVMNISKPR